MRIALVHGLDNGPGAPMAQGAGKLPTETVLRRSASTSSQVASRRLQTAGFQFCHQWAQ
jgi:hypothetical protein